MPRPSWASEEQRAWLEALIPQFIEARQRSTLPAWFPRVVQDWLDKWPSPPSAQDITSAGSEKAALEEKQQYWRNVSTTLAYS